MKLKQIDIDCINLIKQSVILSLNYLNLKVKETKKEFLTYEELVKLTNDNVYQRIQNALVQLDGSTYQLTTLDSLFEVEEYSSQEQIPMKLFLKQIQKSLKYMKKEFVKEEIKIWEDID